MLGLTSTRSALVAGTLLSLASQVLGHMEMSWPYPLHSKYNPANSYTVIDYSMTAPLFADGSNFPCKGYQNDRPMVPVATYSAGSTYNMTIAGSAVHGGGSCQLSLSYDNGATFRVIKSMIGGCPLTSTYDFTIPSYAPDGNALFAWTWQNEMGNREYYMNCAVVTVAGSSASKRDTSSFEALPFIWKANVPGVNTCTTTEGEDPVYPMPGPDVLYGGKMSSSSPANSVAGVCDAATPFGKTYKSLGDTPGPQTATVGGGSGSSPTTVKSSSSQVPTTLKSTTKSSVASSVKQSTASVPVVQSSSSKNTASTVVTLSTVNAGKTKISSTSSTTPLPSASSTDDDCPSDVTLTVYTTAGATAKTSVIPASSTSAGSSPSSTPIDPDTEYATGDLSTYLPCVPGTYICTSSTAWVTCDSTMYSDGSTSWVYRDARVLGNGATCVPSFSPYSSSTKAYAQQADSPAGFYRDDRIAYPSGAGACAENGDVECVGTSGFNMCNDLVWFGMGGTASGTQCQNGMLVSSS
ncbi:hypothetical protein E4T38_06168 [Aureobasidium subglaciale]|nr:hypothetical protein E4T38_06168 [Aureobasidium subglaciale]KAI5219910.1 hypothetical protein E4T40_06189 [Aureobasidium subglaciale]KAI5223625.1 hypothetical protein E4T41_06008 [Aureobasidium subglaciale]KAI5260515.1 hypothetical protein E4T46_05923 [Aureobasidium subglaciale]